MREGGEKMQVMTMEEVKGELKMITSEKQEDTTDVGSRTMCWWVLRSSMKKFTINRGPQCVPKTLQGVSRLITQKDTRNDRGSP